MSYLETINLLENIYKFKEIMEISQLIVKLVSIKKFNIIFTSIMQKPRIL